MIFATIGEVGHSARLSGAPKGYIVQLAAVLISTILSLSGIILLAAIGRDIPSELSTVTVGGVGILYGQVTGYTAGRKASTNGD